MSCWFWGTSGRVQMVPKNKKVTLTSCYVLKSLWFKGSTLHYKLMSHVIHSTFSNVFFKFLFFSYLFVCVYMCICVRGYVCASVHYMFGYTHVTVRA